MTVGDSLYLWGFTPLLGPGSGFGAEVRLGAEALGLFSGVLAAQLA